MKRYTAKLTREVEITIAFADIDGEPVKSTTMTLSTGLRGFDSAKRRNLWISATNAEHGDGTAIPA
jgi:hypothetical protein